MLERKPRVGLDFETFSKTNLKTQGMYKYMADSDFKPLIASLAFEDGTKYTYDFVFDCVRVYDGLASEGETVEAFERYLRHRDDWTIVAHNADFERGVLEHMFPGFDPFRVRDSAVAARALGAEGKLEVASRQLSVTNKLEVGLRLIMKFSVPNDTYPDGPTPELIEANDDMEDWLLFVEYCEDDALAGLEIDTRFIEFSDKYHPGLDLQEQANEHPTHVMNNYGWHMDMAHVQKMRQRWWVNGIIAQKMFVTEQDEQLNFNSHPQMKAFTKARGYPVKSLDKYNLPVHITKVKEKIALLDAPNNGPELQRTVRQLKEVLFMLETKAEIGGSMLSKLPKILDLTSDDDRLRGQYVHLGAGQTFRTASRGVQLQNIAKLNGNIKDITTLGDLEVEWSNTDMASQIRQLFNSTYEDGQNITGDFSAIESRMLAYMAGEEWKLQAYRDGLDVYKVLVTKYIGIDYEDVTEQLRPRGKYSELSCGYQASGKAVKDFMFRLGFDTSIEDALQNVTDWRGANTHIVDLWYTFDNVLKSAVRHNKVQEEKIGYDLSIRVTPFVEESIQQIHAGALSVVVQILNDGEPMVTRVVHGCYFFGSGRKQSLCYYKPVDTLTSSGVLWSPDYAHKELKAANGKPLRVKYSIYGGKLAGILTQSMARELFFDSMRRLMIMLEPYDNANLMGQFHDEINVDWFPREGGLTLEEAKDLMKQAMSFTELRDFPLAVDVKSDYRYTK